MWDDQTDIRYHIISTNISKKYLCRLSVFVSAADQPLNEQETRFALAVVELQVISGGRSEFWGRVETPVTSQLCYQHFNWPLGSRHSAFFCRSLVELTTNIREVSKCHAIAKQ